MSNHPSFPTSILPPHHTYVGRFALVNGTLVISDHMDEHLLGGCAIGEWHVFIERVEKRIASVTLLSEWMCRLQGAPAHMVRQLDMPRWPDITTHHEDVFDVGVDIGSVAIFDRTTFAWGISDPHRETEFFSLWQDSIVSAVERGVNVVEHGCFVESGAGNGMYQGALLRDDERRIVGVRVDFSKWAHNESGLLFAKSVAKDRALRMSTWGAAAQKEGDANDAQCSTRCTATKPKDADDEDDDWGEDGVEGFEQLTKGEGRRGVWVRSEQREPHQNRTHHHDTTTKVELRAGRDGNDWRVVLTEGEVLTSEKLSKLMECLSWAKTVGANQEGEP